ncbi:MAG: rRNA pseudouridine synthase, partial [Bacteroidales bacterium]|nr:rRNA pseudouridine synthase [Bacteroidales bacterium]
HKTYGEHKSYGERKSYGAAHRPSNSGKSYRKGYGKPGLNKAASDGINRMINRRPRVDDETLQPTGNFSATFQEEVRLNKFIANSGVCSRREADTLIQAGVVTVNGEVVTELGTKVNVLTDDIRFNGERLKGEQKVYLVMNKPRGFVTTASDPHAEKTVMELLKGCPERVYPVGRLDKATTGVLMFTNDGEIAERLTHPSFDKKKIYQVSLDRNLEREDYDKILAGVILSDGEVCADELEYVDDADHRKLGIEIHSGKNRIVRRIFESLGYTVKALDRVYFAGLTKKGLKKGEWRYLSEGEVNILKMGAYA